MHRPIKLIGENHIDHPLAFEPREAGEGIGDDLDLEMALAAFAGAGMTGMEVGLVLDVEMLGSKGIPQLLFDRLGYAHDRPLWKQFGIAEMVPGAARVKLRSIFPYP
jgi:hypothetical protein